jgi:hypothetical protein
MVFPAVVEEGDTSIDGLLDHFDCDFFFANASKMMTSHAKSGNFGLGLSEIAQGN